MVVVDVEDAAAIILFDRPMAGDAGSDFDAAAPKTGAAEEALTNGSA